MALTIPAGVDAEGALTVIWTPTPTLSIAELEGPTAVDLTCYMTKGTWGEAAEIERGTDERECSKQVYETLGKTTWTLNALDYVYDPQAAPADPDNKAYETLAPRTPGYFTVRLGVDIEDPLTVGEKVDQFPATVGEQVRKQREGNAGEKLKITQEVVITGEVLRDQALIA